MEGSREQGGHNWEMVKGDERGAVQIGKKERAAKIKGSTG